jgi:type I restriction enzyme S subunit
MENNLIPKLRFPEFDGNWDKKKIGDIGDVKMCKRIFSEETTPNGEIPFYKIGSFGKVADAFITRELFENYKNRFSYPKIGDTLISASGTIGRTVVYNGEEAYYQDSNIVWVENNNTLVSNEFFYYILQLVKFNTEGGTIQRLYNSILKSTKFNCPKELIEQQKIASFLTSVDERLTLLAQQKEKLELYKKGVMQQIFSQKLRFKDENGNNYPDWEEKKLGEIFKIGSGKDYKHLNKGNIPVYGTGGYMTSVDQYLYDGESVGIGRKGTIDKPVFLKGKFWTVDTLFYTHNFINVLPYFVYLIFQTIDWVSNNEGSGVPSLSKSTIEKIKTKVPSIEEQQKIASFLSTIDVQIEGVSKKIEQTKLFKKGLLQQMFV